MQVNPHNGHGCLLNKTGLTTIIEAERPAYLYSEKASGLLGIPVNGQISKLFFDAEELVVFCNPVRTAQ